MATPSFEEDPPDAFHPKSAAQGRGARLAFIVVAIIAAAAVAFYIFRSRDTPVPVAPAPAIAPADPNAAAARAEAADQRDAAALRNAGEGTDEKLRRELGALSSNPSWASWLGATPDLADTGAVIIANVAEDDDPRKRMAPLLPGGAFDTVEQGGVAFESPESMHRYDTATEVISSIDAHALVPIWRTLHPILSVAYHALGRPGVSLDRAAGSALKRISELQITSQPAPIQKVGRTWIYVDPDTEKQGSVEKLVLRAGPANAHKLATKAKELRTELGLP